MRSKQSGKVKRSRRAQDWLNVCSWCGKRIAEHAEVFGCGGKLRPGVAIGVPPGVVLEIVFTQSRNKIVGAIVPANDSPAKRDGYDLYFLVCSEKCAEDLREASLTEVDIEDIHWLH